MNEYRVWFTYHTYVGFNEDYLDVRAKSADQAYENVMNANPDIDVQSVEALD